MTGQHRGGRSQRRGVETALGRIAVTPAVCGDRSVDIAVVTPHEPCELGLGVHGRIERFRGLRPRGALRLERGLDVVDTLEVRRLVEALPGRRLPRPVAVDRMEHARVRLEATRNHRQDAARRLSFHRPKPLAPLEGGHPFESF
ncbi:hypothetical protein [Kocuria arenosa]|uniref:hypothetical protein n=1 Tax=Kocuria arenosa TaxID=3071446 RepID=UPI0034D6FC5C